MPLERVAVIGAGAWGTALAQAAAMAGRTVTLVARDAAPGRRNQRAPQQQPLSARRTNCSLAISAPRSTFAGGADFVILAVPAQASRSALGRLGAGAVRRQAGRAVGQGPGDRHACSARARSSPNWRRAPFPIVLSGPSFAADVAAGRPTAVTLAGDDAERRRSICRGTGWPNLPALCGRRPDRRRTRRGAQEVYALACGAVEGARLGASARSALMARAFAEMAAWWRPWAARRRR